MTREDALERLAAVPSPILVDGGAWQFGHVYYVLDSEGLTTVDYHGFVPMYGPFSVSPARFDELKAWAEGKTKDDILAACDDEIELEEILVLLNDGKAAAEYWAFAPYDGASLDEWSVSLQSEDIEKMFVDFILEGGEHESWCDMVDADLEEWAAHVA